MRISNRDNVHGRFIVATDTPDNGRSTYPECWGAGAEFSARAVYASDNLAEAVATAENYGKWAQVIDRQTGRKVGIKRLAEVS